MTATQTTLQRPAPWEPKAPVAPEDRVYEVHVNHAQMQMIEKALKMMTAAIPEELKALPPADIGGGDMLEDMEMFTDMISELLVDPEHLNHYTYGLCI